MTALGWAAISMGIAGIVAGIHKRTLWGVMAAWLSGQPLTSTTHNHPGSGGIATGVLPATGTVLPTGTVYTSHVSITTVRKYIVTTVHKGK